MNEKMITCRYNWTKDEEMERSFRKLPRCKEGCTKRQREAQLREWLPADWTVTVTEIARNARRTNHPFTYIFHPPEALAALMRPRHDGVVPVVRRGPSIEAFIAEARGIENEQAALARTPAAAPLARGAQVDNEGPAEEEEAVLQETGVCVTQFLQPSLNYAVAVTTEVLDAMEKHDRRETQPLVTQIERCLEEITYQTKPPVVRDVCIIGDNNVGKSFNLNLTLFQNMPGAYEYAEAGRICPKLLQRYQESEGLVEIAETFPSATEEGHKLMHNPAILTEQQLCDVLATKGSVYAQFFALMISALTMLPCVW
jgi:hypothetical protein